MTHATTTIEFNSREFHGCVPGCIDITQSQKALIVVRLVIDRVQSTFYSGVNGVHRASVKLSRCNAFREFHGCARGCMVWPRWRAFFNPLFPFLFLRDINQTILCPAASTVVYSVSSSWTSLTFQTTGSKMVAPDPGQLSLTRLQHRRRPPSSLMMIMIVSKRTR